MQTILVTGGGGYIGSHAVKRLLQDGYQVVVFDNFSRGFREPLRRLAEYGDLQIAEGDLLDASSIDAVFTEHSIDVVMHFAALCIVDESVREPEKYFSNNVIGSFNLLESMRKHNVTKLVFSSTCAVYGEPDTLPVTESHERHPVNPYGLSKKIVEDMIMSYGDAHGLHYAILRYFNVCGADTDGQIGDSKQPSALLVQNAVRGALGIEEFKLTCPTVDTPDGTPIRDYIDVEDLIDAHVRALSKLDQTHTMTINLGNGKGWSVTEIVTAVQDELGAQFDLEKGVERQGEYAAVYADITHARELLDWSPQKSLGDSIQSLARWYKNNPNCYES